MHTSIVSCQQAHYTQICGSSCHCCRHTLIWYTSSAVLPGHAAAVACRPIGLGVQGLADTFLLLGMPFDSPEAAELSKSIFETIYYAALETSSRAGKGAGHLMKHMRAALSARAFCSMTCGA